MKLFHLLYIIPIILILILFSIRAFSPREIDDITPGIPCEKEYIEKSEILWVIPNFQGHDISENKTWCKEILALNKTLGLHGFKHTYREWEVENQTGKELSEAIHIFTKCFGYEPTMFKPPHLHLSKQNQELIEKHLELKFISNQVIFALNLIGDSMLRNSF